MAFVAPAIGIGLKIAGAGMGLAGGYMAAGQARASAGYAAEVARRQGHVADRNRELAEADAVTADEAAAEAGLRGQLRAQDQDERAAEVIGDTRVRQGASGTTGPSSARLIGSLQRLAGRDRLRVAQAGEERSGAFRQQAVNLRRQADDYRVSAGSARADATMQEFNGERAAGNAVLGGWGSAIGGLAGATDIGLGAWQNPTVRARLQDVWKRRPGA